MDMKPAGTVLEDLSHLKEHLDQFDPRLSHDVMEAPIIRQSPLSYVKRVTLDGDVYYFKAIHKSMQSIQWLEWIQALEMKGISHWPWLLQYEEMIYLLEEEVRGVALEDLKATCRLEEILIILSRCASLVDRCHGQGILHLDLKSEHFIVDAQGQPHLIDLGTSRPLYAFSPHVSKQVYASEALAAPECFGGILNISEAADYYSFCLMSLMILQDYPQAPMEVLNLLFEGLQYNATYRRHTLKALANVFLQYVYTDATLDHYNREEVVV